MTKKITEQECIDEFKNRFYMYFGRFPTVIEDITVKIPLGIIADACNKCIPEVLNDKRKTISSEGFTISTRTRRPEIVALRMIFATIARKMKYRNVEIGKYLEMDHTSILHFNKRFFDFYATDPDFVKLYNKVKHILNETPPISTTTGEKDHPKSISSSLVPITGSYAAH